jgi:hypothetical protein
MSKQKSFEECRVAVRFGNDITLAKGKVYADVDKGNLVEYKLFGKQIVVVPKDWPREKLEGYWLIGVEHGKAVAHPLGFWGDTKQYQVSGSLIAEIVLSGIFTILVKSYKASTSGNNVKWLVLGVGIGVLAFVVFNQINGSGGSDVVTTTTAALAGGV